MADTQTFIEQLKDGILDDLLLDLYVDPENITYQQARYIKAIQSFEEHFGKDDVFVYSAPGRSEIGGNHTDHQHGEVLAAAINQDAIAVVTKTKDNMVKVLSEGYDQIEISVDELQQIDREKESTLALTKGVLAGMKQRGYLIGGFQAYITSDVLIGAGLSSSAAYETLIGTIVSGLYNAGEISPVVIAQVGQYAENVYFGKPCGLMDQMACSVGGMVHIDFSDSDKPLVNKIEFDLEEYGYSLCITDTKGSHANLTAEYAAVPAEMKQIAKHFGKEVLAEISREELLSAIPGIRAQISDRALLRALHFVEENERVRKAVQALQKPDLTVFFEQVRESGNSSFKYLQNVYSTSDILHQNLSVALAISDMVIGGQGVSRVHGGGFAGTIQAFVKNEMKDVYKKQMDDVFGAGSCKVLKIRKHGGIRVL